MAPELHVRCSPNICACYPQPSLGPALSALRYAYVMHFRFLDGVKFLHRGHVELSIPLQRVTSLCRRAQANAPPVVILVASCPRRRPAPGLDESIVKGVSGAEPALQCTIALLLSA